MHPYFTTFPAKRAVFLTNLIAIENKRFQVLMNGGDQIECGAANEIQTNVVVYFPRLNTLSETSYDFVGYVVFIISWNVVKYIHVSSSVIKCQKNVHTTHDSHDGKHMCTGRFVTADFLRNIPNSVDFFLFQMKIHSVPIGQMCMFVF